MKSNPHIPACCAALFLAIVLQASAASDGASFVSQLILTNAVLAPGQTFTQTWTLQNTGTTTWSPGASGYTLNLAGTDSLGAVPLFARTSGAVYLPIATNNGGGSVAPGASGTFSMYFIAPETAGTYSDTLQMANASAVLFGPKVGVQIVVQHAGPAGQYDRAKAVSYANNYAAYVCSDGYFWTNSSGFGYYGTGVFTPVPTSATGDDCAHFVSCCIGSESHQKGGGLNIPTRDVTYGEPGAARLVQTVLLAGGLATEVSSLSSLSPGDVIGWNWSGNTNLANLDHDTIYLGNGVLAAHSSSHLDVSANTYYQGSSPQLVRHLIHILNKADTIAPSVAISSPTNGQAFTSSTIALSGTASDAGCPSSGVGLVQVQMNGTGGTWQTASGTNNWSASASLNSGANTIYVRSRDVAGNYSTVASMNVTYTPPDTQGPALAIASPANNATVTSASLPVSGTASDSGYGNHGISSVTVNGVSASGGTASGAGTANWNTTVTLNSGTNLITVAAKDTLNNSSQKQITVTYNPPPPSFGGSSVSGAEFLTTLSRLSAGERVVVEVSSDLKNWTPLQTNTISGSTVSLANAINPAVKSQFFRARVQ
jgi:Ig-like domain from next to BRCA1 gene/Glucodextranase, domain B/Bacterial Ig domain